jgi:hypothetical protein
MGKSSTDSATAVSRKGNEIKYTLEMSAKDKEIQKMRVRSFITPLSLPPYLPPPPSRLLPSLLLQTNGAKARGGFSTHVFGDRVWR